MTAPRKSTSRKSARAARLSLGGSLWLTAGSHNLGGHGRIALLRAVAEHGSITSAAKAFGISYKAAWDAIDAMNRASGRPLVERTTGGRGGGSTLLTDRGRKLVARYAELDDAHQRFVALLAKSADDLDADFSLLDAVNLQTSARNQLVGTVTAVRHGAVNDEIELTLPSGQRIVAVVTHDSTQALRLAQGRSAVALVKASSVLLATGLDGARVSARNQWPGVVAQVRPGAVNAEVVLDIDGGGSVVAVVTQDSARTLGLAPGTRATALVKASDVILAVSA
jgi:molybdate transport system regulatory protein